MKVDMRLKVGKDGATVSYLNIDRWYISQNCMCLDRENLTVAVVPIHALMLFERSEDEAGQ